MSGVERSAHHSGIVKNVILTLTGVLMAAGGAYMYVGFRRGTMAMIFGVIGVGMAAVAGHGGYRTLQELREAGITNPIVIVREDMNEPRRILKGALFLPIVWIVFGVVSVSEASSLEAAYRGWMDLAARKPSFVVGVVGFHLVAILGILFGRGERNSHHM